MEPRSQRPGLRGGDGPPGLPDLRRAGGRPRCLRSAGGGPRRPGTGAGCAPQRVADLSLGRSDRAGESIGNGCRPAAPSPGVPARADGLHPPAGDPPPDPGLRPHRLTGRPAGLDRGEIPGVDRPGGQAPRRRHRPRPVPHRRHALLAHRHRRLGRPAVLRDQPRPRRWAAKSRGTTPTGVAVFTSHDITIRKLAERDHNIVHWKEYPRGGHFPAMEVPEVLVGDVREFFQRLRS